MKAKQKNSKIITIECVAIIMGMIWMLVMHGKNPRIGEAILIASMLSGGLLAAVLLLENTFGGYTLSASTRRTLPSVPIILVIIGLIGYFA